MSGILIANLAIAGAYAGPLDDHATRRATVSLATEVRTLKGVAPWSIDTMLSGAVCDAASGNTCTDLQYPELAGDIGVVLGAMSLDDALHASSTPRIIFGYSEGAVVASRWLSDHAADANAPSADDVSFILIGNPKRKYGGSTSEYISTPPTPNTQYSVLDVAREYDGVADVLDDPTNFLAALNSIAGYFFVHTSYTTVDLVNDDKLVWKEGNTTYVLARTANLPLLDPLRSMGLGFLADYLNAPLKAIVDSAYNRNYPGLITDPIKAQKAVDDALHAPAAAPTRTGTRTTDFAVAAAATAAALVNARSSALSPASADAVAPTVSAARSVDAGRPETVAAQDIKFDTSDGSSVEVDTSAAEHAAADLDAKTDAVTADPDAKADTATPARESRADVDPQVAAVRTATDNPGSSTIAGSTPASP